MEPLDSLKPTLKETQQESYPNINFQPGIHSVGPIKIESSSGWNDETIIRLQKSKPKFIVMDGSFVTGQVDSGFYLESHPEDIDPKYKKIYFVRGDVDRIARPIYSFTRDMPGFNTIRSFETTIILENSKSGVKDGAILGLLGLSLFVIANKIKIESSNEKKDVPKRSGILAREITRRDFLKKGVKAAGYIGGLAIYANIAARSGLRLAAALTKDNEQMEIINSIADKLSFLPFQQWWGDGRTALLIAKTQDAIKETGETMDSKAEIVMGTGHSVNFTKLLKDKEERNKVIHEFVVNVVRECKPLFSQLGLPEEQTPQAVNLLLDGIASTEILAVTKPDGNNAPAYKLTSFFSPQVMEETKDVRI